MLKLTEEELKELGFGPCTYQLLNSGNVLCNREGYDFAVGTDWNSFTPAYPETKEDLQTLIRVFTPPTA